jgi:hypothetical protein
VNGFGCMEIDSESNPASVTCEWLVENWLGLEGKLTPGRDTVVRSIHLAHHGMVIALAASTGFVVGKVGIV